ncbi:DUF479 domain-containing protein [Chitinophaga agrisoli]|uniref:DUF479 domain-containing protein n=1 Tax=Chitinophaga agrisoli TaxID=2607653 RepID=A0A5B2VXY8_9BACT|nr:ACP phosphodiesterase [Chitinophaga agrisoli]KAA2244723.1 DUF479 domain-containing protein [Chitinophaga agrisoli]
MNFLAHAYLSFHDPSLIIGNMIADFVKGKQLQLYAPEIQRGIQIHRAIDSFTDQHAITREARQLFRPSCGLYGAVFMDIIYDHFLARDTQRFTEAQLAAFAQSVYDVIDQADMELPQVFREVFHYMRTQNWLFHYGTREGISRSFNGIVRRARYLDVPASVPFAIFENHYAAMETYYAAFFPELEAHVKGLIRGE